MSIISPTPPSSARKALEADIGTFMAEPIHAAQDAFALPIFVIDRKEPLGIADFDAYGQPSAWRFVLQGKGGHMAIGEVTRQHVDFELSSVSEDSKRANELLHLVERARDAVGGPNKFELRIFEAPAFHIRAIWLHSSLHHHDLFLLIDRRRGRQPSGPMTAEQFAGVFNRAQENKLGPRGYVDFETGND